MTTKRSTSTPAAEAEKAPSAGRFDPAVPIARLLPSPMNPRKQFDREALRELEASIREKGVLTPLLLRPVGEGFEIAAGHRRVRAAQAAGLATVPAVIRELNDAAFLEVIVIENLQRADLHPLEEAEGYRQLHEKHGYSVEDLAAKLGKSKAYVYARLKLSALPEAARKLFYEGKLTPSSALLVARIPNPKLAEEAAKEIGKPNHWSGEPMSYREAARFVQERFMLQLDGAPWPKTDAELLPAAGACGPCPKRTGNAPDLFGDVRGADVCTDPDCFAAKGKAWTARLVAQAREAGREVLDADEAKKLFERYDGRTLKGTGAFLDLHDRCDSDPKWKPGRTTPRSWAKVLGSHAPPTVVAIDGAGKARELIGRKAALDALKKAGIKLSPFERRDVSGQARAQVSAQDKARRQTCVIRRRVHDLAAREVAERAEKTDTLTFWRWLAGAVMTVMESEACKRAAAGRGIEAKDYHTTPLKKAIEQMSAGEVRGLLAELVAQRGYPGEYSGGYGEGLRGAAVVLGVNLKAIEKRVRTEASAKKKARR